MVYTFLLKNQNCSKLEVRNSPLYAYATHIARPLACAKFIVKV